MSDSPLQPSAGAELRIEWCAARDKGKVPPVKLAPPLWYRFRRRIGMAMYNFRISRGASHETLLK